MMRVLMVLNQRPKETQVMVVVRERWVKLKVATLLEENRAREAFEVLRAQAEVEAFVPKGQKPAFEPDVVLFEDQCQ